MKVLYLGVMRDGTGWARAATDYVLALDAAGVDVVPRAVKLNDRAPELPPRLLELEARSARGCDVCVQHLLPHQFDHDGRFALDVGLYASETSDFRASNWADRINQLDRAVVINRQMVGAARRSGVTVPLSVVPHACDVTRYQRSYTPLPALAGLRDGGDFVFYFVGELVRRKGLVSLLKAFHLEFDPSEPVQLVLKTDRPGKGADDSRAHAVALCDEVKRGLKLHGGKTHLARKEVVVTERLTEEGLLRLHAACDCLVLPSYGEAWGYPAFDAMALGKTPVVTACTGFLDYLSDETGWLVPCREEPVFGADDTFEDLYVGTESWSAADVSTLRRCMREAFTDRRLREDKAAAGVARAHDFSYEKVGALFKEALVDDQAGRAALERAA